MDITVQIRTMLIFLIITRAVIPIVKTLRIQRTGATNLEGPHPKRCLLKNNCPPILLIPGVVPKVFFVFFFLLGLVLIKFCLSPSGTHVTYPNKLPRVFLFKLCFFGSVTQS